MKKILLGIATFITMAIICVVGAGAVIYGDYAYTSFGNGTILISDYTGSATELDIPPLLDGQKVKQISYGAFANCTSLVSVSIPNGVTIMGQNVFYGCSSLKSVTIPGSVSSIGANAFSSCAEGFTINCYEGSYAYEYAIKNSLNYKIIDKPTYEYEFYVDGTIEITGYNGTATEIEIPSVIDGNRVTAIGYRAFYESTPVTSVVIPDSVTTIDDQAFYYCESVESVKIPDSVTYIGQSAFQYCRALKTIEIPSSVTSIEQSTFDWCEGLTSATIPNSVTSIGVNAFRDCRALETITIPGSVKTIEWGAFYDCNSLVSATINEGVEAIGESAFRDCEKLAYVSFPSTVTSIGEGVFIYSNNIEEIKVASGNKYYCSENGALFDKAKTKLIRYPSKSAATSYTIPSTVKTINDYAFEASYNLLTITIPDSVEAIGKYAFSSCLYTVTINIGKNVKTIGEDAFIGCKTIESIVIPEGVTRIEDNTFSQCEKLKNIVIPDSVTYIGEYAFSRCEALESAYIPDGVTYIGDYAFQYCELLESAPIPDSVTYIGDYAFAYCGALQGVNLPDGLTYIGKRAFVKCYALTSINIPDTVTDIGYQAFAACNAVPTITIGGGITEIDEMAFWYCNSLTSVVICDGVETIGKEAFRLSKLLSSVVIPDSVTSIDATAFDDCENLVIYCCENSYALSYAEENSIAYKILPSSVANLSATTVGSDSITLSWDKNSSATGYTVSQFKNGEWVKLADTTACTYTISDLTSCTDYGFSVSAYTTSGTDTLTSAPAGLNVTTDHAYSSSYTIDTAATCTTEGSKSKHCTREGCTATTSVTVIPVTDHSCTSAVTKQATCIATGVRTYKCADCSYSYTETIPVTSHTYSSSYTVDKAATCTADGSKSKHCTTNGCTAKSSATVIPMTGHSYTTKAVAPTYYAQGYTYHKCSVCGDNYKDNYVAALALPKVSGFNSPSKSTVAVRLSWTKNTTAKGYIIEQFDGTEWVRIAKITDNETVTYKVTGLTPGTAYKFRAKAYISSATSAAYSKYTSTLTVNTMMTDVKDFASPSKSTTAIRLNWTENKYADGYVIEQYKSGSWVQIADITDGSTVTYKVTGLKSGTAYKFRMKAYSVTKYGETVYGDKTATLTANTLAPSVSGLDLKSRSTIALRLTWEENTSVDGYVVEQYKSGKWVQIADIADGTITEYKVTGLNPATTYKFRIRGYCITKYGDKAYSAYTDVLEKTTAPSAVTELTVKGRAKTAIRLAWEQNTSAKGYIIEQYVDGKWVRVGKVTPNDITEYRIDGLASGTTYKFRVKTYIVTDTSIFSNYAYISGTTL